MNLCRSRLENKYFMNRSFILVCLVDEEKDSKQAVVKEEMR